MITQISEILAVADKALQSKIPPTLLYNEGWLLRLVLKYFKENLNLNHSLSIPQNCEWYSEALLSSPFLQSPPGLRLAEGHTHADGLAGSFSIGLKKKGELTLDDDCDFFYVAEAKLYSPLSAGTKNAPGYNQAARNVACIADQLVRKNLTNKEFRKLGFYVLAPQDSIYLKDISRMISKSDLRKSLSNRIAAFTSDYDNPHGSISWLRKNLDRYLNEMLYVELLTWEEILDVIDNTELNDFCEKCKKYNKRFVY